jgi:putative oxidoreductase
MHAVLSNKYLLLIIRLVLGSIFIYSAAMKIIDTGYFVKSLENYKLLPVESLNIFALIIPSLELIVGIFLLLGLFVKESALIGSIMMIVFIAAIAIALSKGLNIECGCFGTADASRVGLLKIIEDFFILLGFIWLSITGSDFLSILKEDRTETDSPSPF